MGGNPIEKMQNLFFQWWDKDNYFKYVVEECLTKWYHLEKGDKGFNVHWFRKMMEEHWNEPGISQITTDKGELECTNIKQLLEVELVVDEFLSATAYI